MTTATTGIERFGPAIQAALARWSPDECAQFEAEIAQAATRAAAEYDLAPVQRVFDRWWRIAVLRANPLSAHEQAQLARARALLGNPRHTGDGYHQRIEQWTATYGGGASLIVYAIVHGRQRVIILRLVQPTVS